MLVVIYWEHHQRQRATVQYVQYTLLKFFCFIVSVTLTLNAVQLIARLKIGEMVSNFSMKRWAPDGESNYCSDCYEQFSLMNRKHHCRGCGRLLCHACSNYWMLIPEDKIITVAHNPSDLKVPQRCCGSCATCLQGYQSDLRHMVSRANEELSIDREGTTRYLNNPISLQLQTDIRKATYTLYNFTCDNMIQGQDKIPKELILKAKGIVFLTIVKAGFLFSARMGTGLVIARLEDDSWSAPSAVAISGVGWGFQIGGELTDVVLILNTQHAVNAFSSMTQVSLGTELAVSLGPVGRSAGTDMHAGENGASAAFSYAHSKGFFGGISLEASIINTRSDVNRQFYGMTVRPIDLLCGKHSRPKAAEPLYRALTEVMGKLGETSPDNVLSSSDDEEDLFSSSVSHMNASFRIRSDNATNNMTRSSLSSGREEGDHHDDRSNADDAFSLHHLSATSTCNDSLPLHATGNLFDDATVGVQLDGLCDAVEPSLGDSDMSVTSSSNNTSTADSPTSSRRPRKLGDSYLSFSELTHIANGGPYS